ncbi:hypothetical protein [Streptosporangium lutulentum]|uniref:WXG100 family type VII secretion target n=1 Tax=Streptosporangium lutulentum TaxID=1461250 RepID=A0ABT9QFS5_9ACTN|nr:hypothetical protein [Streptosporangium lutulentum]MDP9845625.1 hypothetical protein [Streptosporangium lutulentum]
MNNPYDGLAISKPAVDAGVAQWNVMSGDLERFFTERAARITELNAAAPWGGDASGRAFQQSYMQGDGPDVMLSNGAHLVRQIADAGPGLRRTFENSLGTDAAIAQDLGRGAVRQI